MRFLLTLGVLDQHWILIHGIHVTDLDIEHLARVGASFVYTPTSESIRGGGIAPFANAVRAGVNVALGTDGPMVDYSVDMVEQMKACSMMQHVRHLDPTVMPAETTIEMATINAAKALGLSSEIGSLEPGKRGDVAIFDLGKPHVGVVHRPDFQPRLCRQRHGRAPGHRRWRSRLSRWNVPAVLGRSSGENRGTADRPRDPREGGSQFPFNS